ncbi:MAG: pyridoxamine 5'-phosphate oxidase family protein [Nitrososphaerota archaeon]
MGIKFSKAEIEFIHNNELCRLATLMPDGKPHIVPICYIFYNNNFYMVTDLGTAKLRNIKNNPEVAILIDTYKPNKAILMWGKASILTEGEEFKEVSKLFFKKFYWARVDRWDEGEAAIIKVTPYRKIFWGLK